MSTREIFAQERLSLEIEKNSRKVYVKDDRGYIRFVVSFIVLDEREMWEGNKWLVKVQETQPNEELFELSRQFFKAEDLERAKATFEKMVFDYKLLVKVPPEPMDPRLIFNDHVNYRKIDPDRCGNCSMLVLDTEYVDPETGEKRTRLLCSNKKNLRCNEYMREIVGKNALSSCLYHKEDMVEVGEDFVCDNYRRTVGD